MPDDELTPVFDRGTRTSSRARNRLPAQPMLPETAYQLVHDEALLDGNARLNLATFVTTWMDDHANRLYAETFDKNMIDKDEYPSTAAVEDHCWRILGELWNSPNVEDAVGTSTTGSSEACMLGGLAFKRRWQHARRAEGKSTEKPNLVMSSAVQVCWEKFCNYWDVEMRLVPVTAEHPVFDGSDLENYVDENTIGVVAIMGVTYTGAYEPVREIAAKLDEIQQKTGLDIPIHVDGASGAMIAPFVQPDLEWDFRLERVHSISTSGHKYGGVYPGLGWVVWREAKWLPEDLVMRVSYLGGDMPTFALNFSRPGAQVLLQYYLFLRLGFSGYTEMQQGSQDVAVYLSRAIGEMKPFRLISSGTDIPVFAWTLNDDYTDKWTLYDLSDRLRMRGWLIPAYPLPADLEEVIVQRIVVRADLSLDMAQKLMGDFRDEVAYLDGLPSAMPDAERAPAFHH
ncbi:glutamate decarboxylase [Microbacterium endophyticum]|uniref:Glutamate decarboxylase n=1 Tax=Microbacterium endophyticum TaxID=1526412 RepID=A0A7W4V4V5_9MICO|nr:glutamate decarboxylase [Microbacterium endophyticum]MBB2976860.1 glutamate decarboxylase [Microbacterium endophyticum]NIK35822.1 glutamate decarboxylase [Microbacterium endophyticum]